MCLSEEKIYSRQSCLGFAVGEESDQGVEEGIFNPESNRCRH